jgi:hypothetical protein
VVEGKLWRKNAKARVLMKYIEQEDGIWKKYILAPVVIMPHLGHWSVKHYVSVFTGHPQ